MTSGQMKLEMAKAHQTLNEKTVPQSSRFMEMVKTLVCSEDEATFLGQLRQIARQARRAKRTNKPKD
jgi:hypothetical protein